MNSIIVFGETRGWLRVRRKDSTKREYFDFFVENLKELGYHLMCIDEKYAVEGWGWEVDYDKIESIDI